jgi:hypothetical protein
MSAPTSWERLINNVLFNLHILTIALATGIVASSAKTATDNYINSNSPVLESGHVVLLADQWSDALGPILRELRIAAAAPHAPIALRRPVVVLTGRPKAEARQLIDAAASGGAAVLRRLEVIVRQGDPRLAVDLCRVRAAHAAHVALLSCAAPAAPCARRRVCLQAALLRQLRTDRPRPAALLLLPPLEAGGWQGLAEDFTVLEDAEFVGRLLGVLARPTQVRKHAHTHSRKGMHASTRARARMSSVSTVRSSSFDPDES